jgi:hypothetical protein
VNNKSDVGGIIKLEIDSKGNPVVKGIQSNNSNVKMHVDTGATNPSVTQIGGHTSLR